MDNKKVEQLIQSIKNDLGEIDFTVSGLLGDTREGMVFDMLSYNINELYNLINSNAKDNDGYEWVKVKLTYNAVCKYQKHNGFWESNFDENGYSIFSYDYFNYLFSDMNENQISECEIIYFNKK